MRRRSCLVEDCEMGGEGTCWMLRGRGNEKKMGFFIGLGRCH